MNELSKVSRFMIDKFKESPLVNTVEFLYKNGDFDINKTNIYPLVSITLIESEVTENVILINYEISIVEQRDELSNINNDKLLDQDNLIDNLDETHTIATAFINGVKNNHNDYNIEIESVSTIRIKKFEDTQTLDGVEFSIVMLIENDSPC